MFNFKYIMLNKNATVPGWITKKYVDPGFSAEPALFDLAVDLGATENIASKNKALVQKTQRDVRRILDAPTRA